MTFDNAMNIAGDATGVVSGFVGMLSGRGSFVALGLFGVEKLITGGFNADRAVKEEKKREGVDHLSPSMWVSTVAGEFFPRWWGLQMGSKEWK
ncbi:hypothetical protein FACS189472_17350 [Alphaproteobacteria bacterium]|nr:hypothetical protein FACS189472_17350 [Alphaproteobacteria bacterium]